jgi:putative serine protease PepD
MAAWACTSGSKAAPGASATRAATAGGSVALQQAYVNVIGRVLPSVVEIKTASGLGSGVVHDTAGHIVTRPRRGARSVSGQAR